VAAFFSPFPHNLTCPFSFQDQWEEDKNISGRDVFSLISARDATEQWGDNPTFPLQIEPFSEKQVLYYPIFNLLIP